VSATRRAERGGRSWRRSTFCWLLFALGLANLIAVALAPAATAANQAPTFAIVISDEQALFQLDGLAPGPIGQRCLALSVRNGRAAAAILSANVGGTGLADYLTVTIESGQTSDPATCAGFVGNAVFEGSLAELHAQHGTPDVGVAIPMANGTTGAVRFTLALLDDNRAQGATATATLRFDAEDNSDVLGRDVEPTTTVPTTTSATTTTTTTTATRAATPVPTLAARPGPAPKPTSTAASVTNPAPTAGPTIEIHDTAAQADHGFWPSAGALAAVTARSVELTAKASTVPAVFVAATLFFLAVQGRIDRNDPKLRKAPMRPEPELVFVPRRTMAR
jgi:hypothetical protein